MIKKNTYKLTIDEKQQKLFFYEVSHSIYTPSSKAVLITDQKPNLHKKVKLELNGNLVFLGYVLKIEKLQERYKIYVYNNYPLIKEKITKSLKDVSPKQILEYIGIKKIKYTQKRLIEKHHFPIFQLNKLQIIKQILKAWNLKDFIFYVDLDEALHFHHKDEYWDRQTDIELPIAKNSERFISFPLKTDIYINQKVSIKNKTYKVISITHLNGKTYIEVENV